MALSHCLKQLLEKCSGFALIHRVILPLLLHLDQKIVEVAVHLLEDHANVVIVFKVAVFSQNILMAQALLDVALTISVLKLFESHFILLKFLDGHPLGSDFIIGRPNRSLATLANHFLHFKSLLQPAQGYKIRLGVGNGEFIVLFSQLLQCLHFLFPLNIAGSTNQLCELNLLKLGLNCVHKRDGARRPRDFLSRAILALRDSCRSSCHARCLCLGIDCCHYWAIIY